MTSFFPTGVKDVDWNIFEQLTDQDIINLCQVDKRMSELCKNEAFWEFLSKKRYPRSSKFLKKPYELWKSFYVKRRKLPNSFSVFFDKRTKLPLTLTVSRHSLFGNPNKTHFIGKIHLGDILHAYINHASRVISYIITNIKGEEIIAESLLEFGSPKEIVIPKAAERYFFKFGLDGYEPLFSYLLSLFDVERSKIRIQDQVFDYP